jgi:predicted transcriptional regulator
MARPTNEQRVLITQRRTRVLAMRVEQRPYAQIAAELGITETTARDDYASAVKERREALDAQRDTAVAIETAKLDALEQAAWEVLRREHVVVQHGKVVYLKRKPMLDDAPVLAAIDRLVKIAERRSRLRGYDAPTKVDVSDERRAEIEKYAAELAAWVGNLDEGGAGDAPGEAAAG